ncbi:MAG TPA: D-Ala-D-Ala carboxypeptidase family metallohydrolase [Gemmatimonadaceae bacterium]|nr:D-Ala-D-Ala carboxypeptidase family metallohydrolase [Gemmatimonadaceae bacterium]
MKTLGCRGRTSAAIICLIAAGAVAPERGEAQVAVNPDVAALARMPIVDSTKLRGVIANLAGRSGKLLARFVSPPRPIQIPRLTGNLTYTSKAVPAIQEVAGASRLGKFSLITMRGFGEKISGSLGAYRIGFWPEERGRLRSEAYENPEGFIEVTRQNQDTRLSEHFRLRDFLTHDQHDVWPKYVVLREPLLDKLELVIQDLEDHGVPARNVQVLSGFRTPHYNMALGGGSGRARDSRHQFGDAADIFVDSNHDGRMDDLNRDGRVNFRDTRVILASVERVEAKYPDLIGGVGLYHSSGSHGPFAHIDVRGSRARWTTTAGTSRRSARHSKKSGKSGKTRKVASR